MIAETELYFILFRTVYGFGRRGALLFCFPNDASAAPAACSGRCGLSAVVAAVCGPELGSVRGRVARACVSVLQLLHVHWSVSE
jgi:hypothetical protein